MKQILFNTPMVQAIQENRKTQTRRNPFQMPDEYQNFKGIYKDKKNQLCALFGCNNDCTTETVYPSYQPGNTLYVRETWMNDGTRYLYRANYTDSEVFYRGGEQIDIKWRPSIHMPKEAARIFLGVTGVRVERLQDITPLDCEKEGAFTVHTPILREDRETYLRVSHDCMSSLWNSTIKPTDLPLYGWSANPWVWVIEFERANNIRSDDFGQ